MGLLVNIDNGGTFTDICVTDGDQIVHVKTDTTPHDLTRCFVDGLRRVSDRLYGAEDLTRLLRETDHLRYSTTSGTNAVVERKGTPMAVLVDRGEEELVYGIRDMVDVTLWHAMVPRRPVGISTGDDGSVDPDEFTVAINDLLATNALRIVIALRSAESERVIKSLLLDRYPRHLLGAIPFTLSHELAHDPDDARRALTAVLNSYLHPGMEHFLYGAENASRSHGLARPLLIFRNDGDSARVAKTTALKTWGSGPRGGLEGSLAYARLYDASVLAAMDIGGTTTDISLVVGKEVRVAAFGLVDSARTSFPMPEVRSIGLGGSSVTELAAGRIQIGPRSVGASPGPACFGRGGTNATLTDALLVAGILDAGRHLGGELALDPVRAGQALQAHIAGPLSISVDAAALAVLHEFEERAGASLREAIGSVGSDPATATLLAFGGAGPVLACGIARAAGIPRVIVPSLSAVFSAFGIGFSGLAHEYSVTMPDSAAGVAAARGELLARARRDMFGEGVAANEYSHETRSRVISNGIVRDQAWANGVPSGGPREVADWLVVRASYPLPAFSLVADDPSLGQVPEPDGRRSLLTADGALDTVVYHPHSLRPGHSAPGPAIITGDYLTCLVGARWTFRVSSNSDLILEAAP